MILYSYKEETKGTGYFKSQDQKAAGLNLLSRYEKQSHEIPDQRIYINCRFGKENRIEKPSDPSLKTNPKEKTSYKILSVKPQIFHQEEQKKSESNV